jgi:hypothetical protein
MPNVEIIKSKNDSIFSILKKQYLTQIKSETLPDYSRLDGRVLLVFKSENTKDKEILIDRFGHFEFNGTVYNGNPTARNVLQSCFPQVLFIEDVIKN